MTTAKWNGYGWQASTKRQVRIKAGVRPYGGRLVDVVSENEREVTVIPPHPVKPIERVYQRDEIEELGGRK
jgi:hypothetical protein